MAKHRKRASLLQLLATVLPSAALTLIPRSPVTFSWPYVLELPKLLLLTLFKEVAILLSLLSSRCSTFKMLYFGKGQNMMLAFGWERSKYSHPVF